MKTSIYLIICFLSLSFFLSSCKLEGKNEASPMFIIKRGDIIKNGTDTLGFSQIVEDGAYLLDTIAVGDTIIFKLKITGGFNPIKQLNIALSDKDFAELIYLPKDSLDRIFTADSKYEEGLFLTNESFRTLYFPFQLYAKKANNNLLLNLAVQTTASSQYNSNGFKIKIPFLAPKKEIITE